VSELANGGLLESWAYSLHGKAPRTRKLYLEEAARFARWLAEHGRPESSKGDLLAVTRRDAEAWLSALRADGLAGATIRSRWIALRNLYGWAAEEDEIDESPFAKVKVERGQSAAVPVLSLVQLRALLKACQGKDFDARRDTALIRLMVATGLRLTEAADLRLEDADLTNRVVVVRRGKGGKARLARFDPATGAALDRYRRVRARHRHAALPWLWVGYHGRLTTKGIPPMLERRAQAAGIGHLHAHQLRHTFADRFLSAGGNEGDLQRLGGWESSEIMRRYGSARAVDRALTAYDTVDLMGEL
jgi:site-specific recombinase XerD